MSERKTKVLTTPSGASIELKEYISAGEFLDATETKDGELSKNELAKRLVNAAVVSVNGSKENVAAALRDLQLPDYLFFSKEVAKLTSGDFTRGEESVDLLWHEFFANGRAYLPARNEESFCFAEK